MPGPGPDFFTAARVGPALKRAVLVLSGAPPPRAALDLAQGALLVAVDGGANVLHGWGRLPDVVVGDLDSITREALAWCEAGGARIARFPVAKDDTDAALALAEALAWGAREIVFAGATGGRLDHTLANFGLARRAAEAGAAVRLVEAEGSAWVVDAAHPLRLSDLEGRTASLLALTGALEGVTLEGFRWPLADARLVFGDPRGVSNVVEAPVAEVRVRAGIGLLILPPAGEG